MATFAPPSLSQSEWHAVSIALNDATHYRTVSNRKAGLLGRLYRMLTGNEPQRPLADPRLETIRRFVWASRRRPECAEKLAPELEAQGFSHAQVEALALLSR
jgi:hypothetical protein